MRKLTIILILFTLFIGCKQQQRSTDAKQAEQTEKMVAEANRRIGPPNISNFTEKKFMKMIYELRDKEVKTYSYFMDMNGKLHFLCNSIGYGIPASVQYVNPERIAFKRNSSGITTLPQPEPNGMFMPDGLDATYVLCINIKGRIKPVYSEPKLIVSPFRLQHVGRMQE